MNVPGSKVMLLPNGAADTNRHLVELIDTIKPHIIELIEHANKVSSCNIQLGGPFASNTVRPYSLASGRCGCNHKKKVIFKLISRMDTSSISCEISLSECHKTLLYR